MCVRFSVIFLYWCARTEPGADVDTHPARQTQKSSRKKESSSAGGAEPPGQEKKNCNLGANYPLRVSQQSHSEYSRKVIIAFEMDYLD